MSSKVDRAGNGESTLPRNIAKTLRYIKSDMLVSLTDEVIDETCSRFHVVPDGCSESRYSVDSAEYDLSMALRVYRRKYHVRGERLLFPRIPPRGLFHCRRAASMESYRVSDRGFTLCHNC